MKLFLAGDVPWRELIYSKTVINWATPKKQKGELTTKLFLAGGESEAKECSKEQKKYKVNILESFLQTTAESERYLPYYDDYMLDSGAFSMLTGNTKKINLKSYVDAYIEYINRHDIKKFFELDIDPIIGYDEVLQIRNYIERKTGKKPIPVWHRSRGKEEFLKMCSDYPYVALGGIAIKEIKPSEHQHFTWFINEAHKRGAKIHGLGYTNLKGLQKYHFNSVDSSSWVSGNRFGHVYRFNGKTLVKYDKPEGMRVKNKKTALNNFVEWVKFSEYVANHY